MPQPITAADASSQRQATRSLPTPRQMREQRFRQLVRLYRIFTRLTVDYTLHGAVDDADATARKAVNIEDSLEREFSVRWGHVRPRLLVEQAGWWSEQHTRNAPCSACKILSCVEDVSVAVPAQRKVWE